MTILIGQTEVALTRDRSIDELRHTLQSNLEEFERVRAIINDMLFLARADQGERATGLVEVSLAAEVARTLEFLEIPLEEAQVQRSCDRRRARVREHARCSAARCINLVMNAIQHCAPGATISGVDRARTRAHQHRGRQSRRADRSRRCSIICSTASIARKFAHQQPRESRARAGDREGGRGDASRHRVGDERAGRQHVRVFGGAVYGTNKGRAAPPASPAQAAIDRCPAPTCVNDRSGLGHSLADKLIRGSRRLPMFLELRILRYVLPLTVTVADDSFSVTSLRCASTLVLLHADADALE